MGTLRPCGRCNRSCRRAGERILHYAMSVMFRPLIDAGHSRLQLTYADGGVRHIYPILSLTTPSGALQHARGRTAALFALRLVTNAESR